MKRIRKSFSREDGNILIMFAGSLVLIFFMIGILLDLGMIYMRKNDMMDLCQLAREKRFTYQEKIRYADNPGECTYQIVSNSIRENGFNGQIEVYFYETEPDWSFREYRVGTKLSEEYSFTFLRLFGFSTTTISTYVEGGESYGERLGDMIWHPEKSCSSYNGLYRGTVVYAPEKYDFIAGEIPESWRKS